MVRGFFHGGSSKDRGVECGRDGGGETRSLRPEGVSWGCGVDLVKSGLMIWVRRSWRVLGRRAGSFWDLAIRFRACCVVCEGEEERERSGRMRSGGVFTKFDILRDWEMMR